MAWPVEGLFFAPRIVHFLRSLREQNKEALHLLRRNIRRRLLSFSAEDRGKNGEFFLVADVKEWALEYVTVQIRHGPSTNKS